MMNPIHFLFNVEYDVELQNSSLSKKMRIMVEAMAALFAPALSYNDTIISHAKVSSQYYTYLRENGISSAKLGFPEKNVKINGDAWGWSDSAIEFFSDRKQKFVNPDPSICREVNGRIFGDNIAKSLSVGVPESIQVKSIEEIQEYIHNSEFNNFVVKPIFGSAGSGFHFIRDNSSSDILKSERLLTGDPVIIEPWIERNEDIATVFSISPTGDVYIIGHHRNICNNSGTFLGTLIVKDDPIIAPWLQQIENVVTQLSLELHKRGYFGVVSIDSFTYSDNNREKIALAIDINCRYTMSYIAHSLYKKINTPVLFYRFLGKKRNKIPSSYEELRSQLGEICYSKEENEGVIAVSPLRITGSDNVLRQSSRSAFCIVGSSVDKVMTYDDELRKKFSRSTES